MSNWTPIDKFVHGIAIAGVSLLLIVLFILLRTS